MTQEQLRMQMLAGIITEGQYKEKMDEADSYSRVGKSYPAPSTPEPHTIELISIIIRFYASK